MAVNGRELVAEGHGSDALMLIVSLIRDVLMYVSTSFKVDRFVGYAISIVVLPRYRCGV